MGKTNNVRFYFKSDAYFLFAAPLFPLVLELLALFVGHFHKLVLKRSVVAEMLVNCISMFTKSKPETAEQNTAKYK